MYFWNCLIYKFFTVISFFLVAQTVKNPPAMGNQRPGFNPWVSKIPWRRAWQPTPIFLPGEPHGQRSLAGHSPWGHKELDMTEQLTHTNLESKYSAICPNREPAAQV